MHRTHDEFGVAALDQIAQLARARGGIGFGILGGKLDLAPRNAAASVDNVNSGLGAFIVPVAPG